MNAQEGLLAARSAVSRGLDYTNQFKEAHQELSERSLELRDLLTLPTAVSLSGLALVIHGSQRIETLGGVNEVAIGRSFDLVDGFLARSLNQESDTGAVVDASCDKVGMGFMVANAWKKNVVPKEVLSVIISSNLWNAGFTGVAALRHPDMSYRPPKDGKHAMSLYNASFLSYAYAHALEAEHSDMHFHEPLRRLGAAAAVAGTVLAIPAAREYVHRALTP